MVSASFMQVFGFVLILVIVMAGVAFKMSKKQGQSFAGALLESGIWGGSLVACAGADYLLILLKDGSSWV